MGKYTNAANEYSVLFHFPTTVSASERYYLPDIPWMNNRKTYALQVVSPEEFPAVFNWEGTEYNYMSLAQLRAIYFTLKNTQRAEVYKDAIPLDFISSLNGSQVRVLQFHEIWLNLSYLRTTNAALFEPTDAMIFKFWYV